MNTSLKEWIDQLNQPHLLEGIDLLSSEQQNRFLTQLKRYSPLTLKMQRELLLKPPVDLLSIQPLTNVSFSGSKEDRERGEELLSKGKASCLILAGGQGSRLQQGPKGLIPITRILHKSFLQLFCEKVKAASFRYGHAFPLYIMTSFLNHQVIEQFLKQHDFFGLSKDQVVLFQQELLPFLDETGNWLLEQPGTLAEGPCGNAQSIEKMISLEILQMLSQKGIDSLQVIFIDNPLADPFDSNALGLKERLHLDVVIKGVKRESKEEKMGVLIEQDGHLQVLEYSELPSSLAALCPYSSTGLLCFSISSLLNLYLNHHVELPFHIANKTTKIQDPKTKAEKIVPVYKYEQFLFDLLPFFKQTAALIYPREEIYAPLKNATGDRSLFAVQEALLAFDKKVLSQLTGSLLGPIEIELDPAFYYPDTALKQRWEGKRIEKGGYIAP